MPNHPSTIARRRWYYADADQQAVGPLTEDHLRLLKQDEVIAEDTLVVPEGSEEWIPYSVAFSEEAPQPPPLPAHPAKSAPPTTPCPFCAEPISHAAKKCKHCGEMLDHSLRTAQQTVYLQAPQPKKKSGCIGMLAKLILGFFIFSMVLSFVASYLPSSSSSTSTESAVASSEKPAPQTHSPDYESGVLSGDALGKEWASQEGGRPYPEGIQFMAKQRVDDAKPDNQKQWIKGFEAGFNRGWDSIRGSRNADAYTQLTWETAKTGARLYDIDEKHRATLVRADYATGDILVRYTEGGAVEKKNLKAMARFWFVKKEDSAGPDLSRLQTSDWPKYVALKSEMLFELPENKGSATASPGTRVELVHYSQGVVRIRFMGVEKEIPAKETNFEEEVQAVHAQRQQQERQEIERLAAAEQAKLNAKEAATKALRARIEADAGKEPSDVLAKTLVKIHLKTALHDPGSAQYESWSDVEYAEYSDGKYAWCITVTYRAKNAFGAYVRNQNTGYIRNERLISFK